jgi:hypothetical protein
MKVAVALGTLGVLATYVRIFVGHEVRPAKT